MYEKLGCVSFHIANGNKKLLFYSEMKYHVIKMPSEFRRAVCVNRIMLYYHLYEKSAIGFSNPHGYFPLFLCIKLIW